MNIRQIAVAFYSAKKYYEELCNIFFISKATDELDLNTHK